MPADAMSIQGFFGRRVTDVIGRDLHCQSRFGATHTEFSKRPCEANRSMRNTEGPACQINHGMTEGLTLWKMDLILSLTRPSDAPGLREKLSAGCFPSLCQWGASRDSQSEEVFFRTVVKKWEMCMFADVFTLLQYVHYQLKRCFKKPMFFMREHGMLSCVIFECYCSQF